MFLEIARNLDGRQYNPIVVFYRAGWFCDHLQIHNIGAEFIHCRRSWDVSVLILGFRDDERTLPHLMDVLILSSISDGPPLSVVDAMAASKPVVAANAGGLPEIDIHELPGYLVPAGNSAALVENISILLRNRSLREQMPKKGREITLNGFSIKTMIKDYQTPHGERFS